MIHIAKARQTENGIEGPGHNNAMVWDHFLKFAWSSRFLSNGAKRKLQIIGTESLLTSVPSSDKWRKLFVCRKYIEFSGLSIGKKDTKIFIKRN